MSDPSHHSLGGHKKRGKRGRKFNEKELLKEYNSENQSTLQEQRNMYENMQHLSENEKNLFEQPLPLEKEVKKSMLLHYALKQRKLLLRLDLLEQVKPCLRLNMVCEIF